MIRKIAALSLTLTLLLLAACSSGGLSRKEMSEGEKLFRAYCRSCHRLPDPRKHSDDEWLVLVQKYSASTRLSDANKDEIVRYLQRSNRD